MIFAWSVVVLAGVLVVASRAVANGYLLVMRSRRHGMVVLEHGADERYHVLRPLHLPFALSRYLTLYVAYSLLLLYRRAHSWGQHRKPVPLTAKA